MTLNEVLAKLPLIAILRGVKPNEVLAIAESLLEAGFLCIEVPMNSPDPLTSIACLQKAYGDQCLMGGGTVVSAEQLKGVVKTQARLVISPHVDTALIKETKQKGLFSLPGFTTPSEAYAAINAGADALKLFPSNLLTPEILKAIKTILPPIPILPVGGIVPAQLSAYLKAGAAGFGLGSALYKPGDTAAEVKLHAESFIQAFNATR